MEIKRLLEKVDIKKRIKFAQTLRRNRFLHDMQVMFCLSTLMPA